MCVCLHVCVQAPLESINPKSNRLTAEAAFDVCWIPLWNIGCCFYNIHFLLSHQEYIVLSPHLHPHPGARIVQQDRWLACYEFVYNSGVFSPVLWSVILHLWALLIPFLSCLSLLIFDPNLKPPHRMRKHGLRGVVFLTFRFNAYICQGELGSSCLWVCVLTSRVWEVLIAIYFYLFAFYCGGLDLNPACF